MVLRRVLMLGVAMALAATVAACPRSQQNGALRVGFIPSENMQEVLKNAQPIVDRLHQALGRDVQPFVATDYAGVVEALRGNKLDIAFLSPAAYVMAKEEAGVKVLLKTVRGNISSFYGAIIVRRDSGINTIQDLKDKTFAFGDPLSTSGHVFPKKLLRENGLDPSRDFQNVVFAGGHDATVLSVFNRKADAGATYANNTIGTDGSWLLYLKTPEEQQQIKVLAYTEPIPADCLVANQKLDDKTVDQVKQVFTDLSGNAEGRAWFKAIYRIDAFVPATDAEYEPVRSAFKAAGLALDKAISKNP